jgi:hypothetical protein
MEALLLAVSAVLGGIILWNIAVKLRVITLLAQRAVTRGTVRGYWGDFFAHCTEGKYSTLVSLVVAVPLFLCLAVVAPFVARRRRQRYEPRSISP